MIFTEHGGDIFSSGARYDFSVNLNPLGMPESVKNAVIAAVGDCEAYPDPFCRALTERLSETEGVPPEKIVCGNGAADLIYRIVSAVRPKKAVVAAPSFGEYEKALAQCGSAIRRFSLREEDGFALSGSFCDCLDGGVDLVFLCSPNNPTGRLIPPGVLEQIAEKCREERIVLVCDECFLPFAENGEEYSAMNFLNPFVVLLKAFTKIFSMAGLRLGYAVFGNAETACAVRETGQFWSVSAPAQAAGIAALSETDYLEKTVRLVKAERAFLSRALSGFGFRVCRSDANFLLFSCGVPLREMLLREKILIRGCENFDGLPRGFYRIAVRGHEENAALVSAIGRCLHG